MAKFDILATVVETRSGEFLVMVSSVPRPAWSGQSELEEAVVRTREEADALCERMITHTGIKVRGRGDEVGEVIGPKWKPEPGFQAPRGEFT